MTVDAEDPRGWVNFWDNLYLTGRWEPGTHQLLRDVLKPGDLFLDIGAWIGPVTCWALDLGARVIAVEPDPVALPELRARTAGRLVEIHPCAVGAAAADGYLAVNPKPGGFYGDSMSRLGTTGIPVRVRTVAGILSGRIPNLIKVDVEGGEMTLLPSLAPWCAARRIPLQVSIHGAFPARSLFDGFSAVTWPTDPWADIVALP